MSTYVMADLHGHFTELQQLLKKINFTDADKLIIAGDIIDRGPENLEMLQWMESRPANVEFIRGNHDEEFIENVNLTRIMMEREPDLTSAYNELRYMEDAFDHYGTLWQLIDERGVTLDQLTKWADIMAGFPYLKELKVNDKNYLIVHAGYMDEDSLRNSPLAKNSSDDELRTMALSKEHFYIYAREEALLVGGKRDTIIIAGHTPTIAGGIFGRTGKVLRHERLEINSIIYDIDCGAGFLERYPMANMACIRLEDEEIFYLR